MEQINIPETKQQKRVVIIGGGFAGIKLAKNLDRKIFQVVLIDKNNYHAFQPLFYQVAASGIEPSAISFPLRTMLKNRKNIHFRLCTVEAVDTDKNTIQTNIGSLAYDFLFIATGCKTNFFGNNSLKDNCLTLKSVSEALQNRNHIISSFEEALNCHSMEEKKRKMCFTIVGGGATGIEMAGALAEMRHTLLPKTYRDLDPSLLRIILIDTCDRLLKAFSEESSAKVYKYLSDIGVEIKLGLSASSYENSKLTLSDGSEIDTDSVFWVAGVTANALPGLKPECYNRGNRINVDKFNKVIGYDNIFAIGDTATMIDDVYPNGHPQVVQPAIQQAVLCAKNLKRLVYNMPLTKFTYQDRGSMATVGKRKAVVELQHFRFGGFGAWLLWLFVHLMSIVGVKNRIFVFFDWMWSYLFFAESLRLLIKPVDQGNKQQIK